MSEHASGTFTGKHWEETGLSPADESPRLVQAKAGSVYSGGIESEVTTCLYAMTYVTDASGAFAGQERLSGSLDGRAGSFVIEQRGTFDETGTVHCTFEVVAGSGTGELTGLRGQGSFTATQGEESYPYTFDYEL
jgi:hypothetical protein